MDQGAEPLWEVPGRSLRRLLADLVGVTAIAAVAMSCGSGSAADLGDPVAADAPVLTEVDWNNVTYSSVCGLDDVVAHAGMGETPTHGEFFGVEIIDTAVGELDGLPGDDAAVLVDCLGADTYRPRVLVVAGGELVATTQTSVTPLVEASLSPGYRPLAVDVGGERSIEVTVDDHGERAGLELQVDGAGTTATLSGATTREIR